MKDNFFVALLSKDDGLSYSREKAVFEKAGDLSASIGLVVGLVIIGIDLVRSGALDVAMCLLLFAIAGVQNVYSGIKTGYKYPMVIGCIHLVAVIVCIFLLTKGIETLAVM